MRSPMAARPTTHRGIAMRSRLEAGFAAWLDSVRLDWTYEPQCYASELGQYLPDFHLAGVPIRGAEPRHIFVEVKHDEFDDWEQLITQGSIIASNVDIPLYLAQPGPLRAFLTEIAPVFGGTMQWTFNPSHQGDQPAVALAAGMPPLPWPPDYWRPNT